MSLRQPSRETFPGHETDGTERKRAKPIKGGTMKCAHCDEKRAKGSPYCRKHRADYQSDYRKRQREEFKRLKKLEEQTQNSIARSFEKV